MTTTIKIRRDTEANWTEVNPILASGEPGLEIDTLRVKYGDGETAWNDLDYSAVGNAVYATSAGTANIADIAYSVDVSNVANIGNIAIINLDGNAANALRGNGSFGPIDSAGNSISNGLSEVSIGSANGNVLININDGSAEWEFQENGTLILPGDLALPGGLATITTTNGGGDTEISTPGNIVLHNSTGEWTFGDNGTLTVPGDINAKTVGFPFTEAITNITTGNATVIVTVLTSTFGGPETGKVTIENVVGTTEANEIWYFQAVEANEFQLFEDAACTIPVNGTAWTAYVSGGTAYSSAFDSLAMSTGGFQLVAGPSSWYFGMNGNITLPSNGSSINYSNGAPYVGYSIPYTVDTFVANTRPGFGEIQFANYEGSNSAPATAQKLFINASPKNEQSLGTIFQQWTSNSYRGTLSLNNSSDSQATFNISNGGLYFEPETYRGFRAGLNQIWGDDPSINQLIITNATAPIFYNTDFLLEDDVFHSKGLATGNTHVMLNVYGSDTYKPINPQNLWSLFTSFVDNILYDGSTLRTDPGDMKTQFYNNTGNFRDNIPNQDLYQYFGFTVNRGADYFGAAPTTTNGSGIAATVRIRVNANNTYTILGTDNPGTGYVGGETLTVLGTDLGGASPANDLTIQIDSVDGDGRITAISYLNGDSAYPWPPNYIEDGNSDQYDTGNYINTNLATEISYGNGDTQIESADFGGGDYCVMYDRSFFCMVVTGSTIDELFYSGNLGSDGSGFLNWTGLRNNSQNVTPNNFVQYAYFDCVYLDGEITPTVGTTYNMTLDSAGINLDEFYAYYNNANNDYYFGSNNEWRLESKDNLTIQSYRDMFIQTLTNEHSIEQSGPTINIYPSRGSAGQEEINAQAGQGGSVNITGGDAGIAGQNNDVASLGNNGGSINITAGMGSGNSVSGSVNIYGGSTESPSGIAGNVNIQTYTGPNGNGRVSIATTDGTSRNWAFNPDGSTIYPTLTVTRGDRTGTLTGQTILFGDSTQEVILTTPNGTNAINSSQRFVINPGAGYANTTGEGGDIYLYAGRGGDLGGSGGDIKIRGGLGPVDGYGGYIDIQGGEAAGNGPGGEISIFGGVSQAAAGGNIRIEGGYGGTNGGNILIIGGTSANSGSLFGNVTISSNSYNWVIDNEGNLTLPGNTFSVNYANGNPVLVGSAALGNVTVSNVTIQGDNSELNLSAGADFTANLAYLQVRAGDVASHIHFDTGNSDAYDLIVGNDSKFVQVSSTGNIIMSSYDGNASHIMKLDTAGNVTFPGVLGVAGGTTTSVPVTNENGVPGIEGGQTVTGTVASNPGIDTVQPGWTVTGNNLIAITTVTSVVETSPNFYTITTDTNEVNPFWYNDVYTFSSPGISNWVFTNNNILTLPRDEIANTDPFLRIVGGNEPRIVSENASLTGPANFEISALNTIFTGLSGNAITIYPDDGEIGADGNLQIWTNLSDSNVSNNYSWTFDSTGNLSSTGGISVGNVSGNGYAKFTGSFDESQASTAGIYLGYAGGTPRMMFGTGNTSQTFEIDNDGGNLRFYQPGNTKATLTSAGDLSTAGAITATGKIGYANGGTATQSGTGQGVTINQLTGQITLAKDSWSAGDTEIFNLSCNKVANADYVMAQSIGTAEASFFNVVAYPYTPVANSVRIQVTALETATTAPIVQYLIMRAATS